MSDSSIDMDIHHVICVLFIGENNVYKINLIIRSFKRYGFWNTLGSFTSVHKHCAYYLVVDLLVGMSYF